MKVSLLMCALVAAIGAAAPTSAPGTQPAAPAPSAQLAKALDRPIPEIALDQISLIEVIDFLRDITGANIHVDWASLARVDVSPKTPVSARMKDIKFAKALDTILADVGHQRVTTLASGDIIRVLARKDVANRAAALKQQAEMPVTDPALAALLSKRLPEVNFKDIQFSDTIDFLRDITGAQIVVNWEALEAAGVKKTNPVSVRLRDVRLREALPALLEGLGGKAAIGYRVNQKVIHIEPAPRAA